MPFPSYMKETRGVANMFYCDACKTALNSSVQYSQHLEGKSHAKKLKAGGVTPGKPAARPKINFVPASDSQLHSIQDRQPQQGPGGIGPQMFPPPPSAPPQPPTAMRNFKKNNKKKGPKGSAQPQAQAVTSSDDPDIYCDGVTVIGLPPIPKERFCEICQLQLNSEEQATQHYLGSKHNKKARLQRHNELGVFSQPEAQSVGLHFCSFCNIYVNSSEQMEVHRGGSQHLKAVEKRKRRQEGTEGAPAAKVQQTAGSGNQGPPGMHPGRSVTPVPGPDEGGFEIGGQVGFEVGGPGGYNFGGPGQGGFQSGGPGDFQPGGPGGFPPGGPGGFHSGGPGGFQSGGPGGFQPGHPGGFQPGHPGGFQSGGPGGFQPGGRGGFQPVGQGQGGY